MAFLMSLQPTHLHAMRGLLETLKSFLPLPPTSSPADAHITLRPAPVDAAFPPSLHRSPLAYLDDTSQDDVALMCDVLLLDKMKLTQQSAEWRHGVQEWVKVCWQASLYGSHVADRVAGDNGSSDVGTAQEGMPQNTSWEARVARRFAVAQTQTMPPEGGRPEDGNLHSGLSLNRAASGFVASVSAPCRRPGLPFHPHAQLVCLLARLDRLSQAPVLTSQPPGTLATAAGQQLVEGQLAQAAYADLMHQPERVESWRQLADLYDMVRD